MPFTERFSKAGVFLKTRLAPTPVRLLLAASFLQSIITVVLELLVLDTNLDISAQLNIVESVNAENAACVQGVHDVNARIKLIAWENRVFTTFQVWQFLMVISSVLNRNTIQIIAVALTNIAVAIYSVVQTIESVVMHTHLTEALYNGQCLHWDELQQTYRLYSFQIPMSAVNVVFTLITLFLSYKLYRLFGWKIYQTIGGSYEMHHIYKVFLVFSTLLQLDLFFLIAQAGVWIRVQMIIAADADMIALTPEWYQIAHQVGTGLIAPWLLLGWWSAYAESKVLMGLFLAYGVAQVFNQTLTLVLMSQQSLVGTWYFFVFLSGIAIVLTLLTMGWALNAVFNFHKGLKPLLQSQSIMDEKASDQESLKHAGSIGHASLKRYETGSSENSTSKRWAIDDDS